MMASISKDATGWFIQFQFPKVRGGVTPGRRQIARKRYRVRLTGWSDERVSWAKDHVEKLVQAAKSGRPIELSTLRWVQRDAPDALRHALAESGLVEDRRALRAAVDSWIDERSSRVKPERLADLERVGDSLVDTFGVDAPVESISERSMDDWLSIVSDDHAPNTIAKYCRAARQFFRWCVAERLIDDVPTTHLPITFDAATNREFVERCRVDALIAIAEPPIRVALVMARYGGLRAGEILRIEYQDFDWVANSLQVRDTKRAQMRTIPVFPAVALEIRPHWKPGVTGVMFPQLVELGQRGITHRIRELAKQAGVWLWPRLMHNLRASRESELLEQFSPKDVFLWIGNSEAVAMKHYAMTRDETFARATKEEVA